MFQEFQFDSSLRRKWSNRVKSKQNNVMHHIATAFFRTELRVGR